MKESRQERGGKRIVGGGGPKTFLGRGFYGMPLPPLSFPPALPLSENWGVAKGSSVSWVTKFKGDRTSECELSNGWSRSEVTGR